MNQARPHIPVHTFGTHAISFVGAAGIETALLLFQLVHNRSDVREKYGITTKKHQTMKFYLINAFTQYNG